LFQCLWNSCWWYDCPLGAEPSAGSALPGEKLFVLMEHWETMKKRRTPAFRWLRSRRPPRVPLGSGAVAVFSGHDNWVNSVAISPDGNRIVSGGGDDTMRVSDPAR